MFALSESELYQSHELWRDHAACIDEPTDTFFLEGLYPRNSLTYRRHRDYAKAICASCDARADCLDYALRNDIREGIWGGLTANERLDVRWPNRTRQRTLQVDVQAVEA